MYLVSTHLHGYQEVVMHTIINRELHKVIGAWMFVMLETYVLEDFNIII